MTPDRQRKPELLELADENGTVYWLDLSTGRQFSSSASANREAELLAPVKRVFAEHGYCIDPSRSTLNVRIEGRAAKYDVGVFANGDREIVCSYTFVAMVVPAERRIAVAVAMTCINARIWLGNFELDPEDGYMRFRMNADVEGSELSATAAERLVHEGSRAWDDNYDTLMGVAVGHRVT